MNKDQYEYDIGVQISNRTNDIQRLESKLARLRKLRENVYRKGQEDKINNKRQNTLVEYRQELKKVENKINNTSELAESLKKRNGLLREQSKPKTPPKLEVLLEDIPNAPPDIKEWLLLFCNSEAASLEKIQDALDELSKEIDATSKNL